MPSSAQAVIRALLLCDLVDSTKQIASTGDRRAAEIMQRHDQVARGLLEQHGGREIDKTDGFFHIFELPIDAVRYALAYHRALAELSEEMGVELSARVGIHLGEIWTWENAPADVARGAKPLEVEGQAKQMAARLMSLGEGRQTLLTTTAVTLAKRSADGEDFARDWEWVSHEPYRFKGIPEPVEVFEVGIRGSAPLSAPAGSAKASAMPPSRRRLWAGIGAVAALAVAFSGYWLGRDAGAPEPVAAVVVQETPSVAVLPFVDLSPEKDQEYFTDGLAEELLNVLARLEGLRVAARTSAFSFKGKNVKVSEIARELNVTSILEGSVRKAGDQVRITAQLINAADGFQLWSRAYNRRLDDIFAVQDDIAGSVAEALKVELLGSETPAASGGTSAEAYNAYLQGRYFADRFTVDDLGKAIDYYQQALAFDDTYAPAWAALSNEYLTLTLRFGDHPMHEVVPKARHAAERALELDDSLAAAHLALGSIQRLVDWDWAGAAASSRRGLELEPDNVLVILLAASIAQTLGHFDKALELGRRALELDPLNNLAYYRYGQFAWKAGRLDAAAAALAKALEFSPDQALAHALLGQVYLSRSRPEEALREIEREPSPFRRLYGQALAHQDLGHREAADTALNDLIEKHGDHGAYQIAVIQAYRGDVDQAFEWLDRAYVLRDPGLAAHLKGDPFLANLRDDPRYAAFLDKMGLPQ